MRNFLIGLALVAAFACTGWAPVRAAEGGEAAAQADLDPDNTVYLDLTYGRVVIKLHPELAPNTVARFKELIRQGFYDGLAWHRVIAGFMAQTGDPHGDGTGGSGQFLKAEFNRGHHVRGAVSMARAASVNSADSQFFIVLAASPQLDGQYTYFGEVVSGMEFVDQIRKGSSFNDGAVTNPDHIQRMNVAGDPPDMPKVAPKSVQQELPEHLVPVATPTPGMAATFDGASFKCANYTGSLTNTATAGMRAALGRIWITGYLAGFYKAKDQFLISHNAADQAALDGLIVQKCSGYPQSSLRAVASQIIGKEGHPVPDLALGDFAPLSQTCAQYTDAKTNAPATAELANLWVFAFIQGFKNVAQPDMVITLENGAMLAGITAKHCAANPTISFVDLAALVADRVKLNTK